MLNNYDLTKKAEDERVFFLTLFRLLLCDFLYFTASFVSDIYFTNEFYRSCIHGIHSYRKFCRRNREAYE